MNVSCRDLPHRVETYLASSMLYVNNASTPPAGRKDRYGSVRVSELSSAFSDSQSQQLVLIEALEIAGP